MIILCHFAYFFKLFVALVSVHCNCIEKSTICFSKRLQFCERKKIILFWNDMRVNKWWQCSVFGWISLAIIGFIVHVYSLFPSFQFSTFHFLAHFRLYHGLPVICSLLTVICLKHDRRSRTSCKLNMSLSFFSFWRRHASLPLDVTDNPGNFIVPLCRRSYPCRKWKSASLG